MISTKEIDLTKSNRHEHPDIKTDGTLYLVRFNNRWYLGPFIRVWFGLSFPEWGNAGMQFDAPGYNKSSWERVLEVTFND